ncbi:MAG: hypothetical protein MUD10_04215 [Candidatus Pacebacteria bacterium]|jgi:hypothetical protein|nr:hypothetical protein [Candidatus Paceibacterota bacterium]
MDKKMMIPILAFLFSIIVLPAAASAAVSVGNEAISRISLDGTSNFVVVDTNNPANKDGTLATFTYYATQSNKFRFLLVDADSRVKWISELITPAAAGVNTYSPAASIEVKKGWNLGVHFLNNGMIPYALTGATAKFTNSDDGLPVLGNTIQYQGYASRTYSIGAASAKPAEPATTTPEVGNATTTDTGLPPIATVLAGKKLCLAGQWADIVGTSFKNQGQCVSYYNQQILGHIENLMKRIIELQKQLLEIQKKSK